MDTLDDVISALMSDKSRGKNYALVVELVFPVDVAAEEVVRAIREFLPDTDVSSAPALEDGADRFHFATFLSLDPAGREAAAFELARRLETLLSLERATPVLRDSLYGGAVAADTLETLVAICETPRRDDLPDGWIHPFVRTPEAWESTRGEGTTVALIDTGHSSHVELSGVISATGQLNLVEGGTDALDRFSGGLFDQPGHGTLVASVVASRGSADRTGRTGEPGRITGVAPAATICSIRAIHSVIDFSQTTIPRAIRHAVQSGTDVIVMALGGSMAVGAVEKALREAVAAGVVVVCAAGNCWPFVIFPAAYARRGLCCAVAAVTVDGMP